MRKEIVWVGITLLLLVVTLQSAMAIDAVALVSPVNNTEVSSVATNFTFNVTNAQGETCYLYIDNATRGSVVTGGNSTDPVNATYNISNSTYLKSINNDALNHSWYVNCSGTVSQTSNFSVKDTNYDFVLKTCYRTLSDSGNWVLGQDLQCDKNFGLVVILGANNIDFSGNGYSISTNGASATAVDVRGSANVIHDLTIATTRGGYNNVALRLYSGDATVYNVTTTGVAKWLYISSETSALFVNNSKFGKVVITCGVATGATHKLINSWFDAVDFGQYSCSNYDGNFVFYNNDVSGTVNWYSSNNYPYIHLNTTKQSGTNIIGGSYIGGNYWEDNSDCYDPEIDGICNDAYNVSGVFDYLPLRYLRPLVNNAPNLTAPMENQSERNNITVTLGSRSVYEHIYLGLLSGEATVGQSLSNSYWTTSNLQGTSFIAKGNVIKDIKFYVQSGSSAIVESDVRLYKGDGCVGTPVKTGDSFDDIVGVRVEKGQTYTIMFKSTLSASRVLWYSSDVDPDSKFYYNCGAVSGRDFKYDVDFYDIDFRVNSTNTSEMSWVLTNVSSGDKTVYAAAQDVSGEGSTNATTVLVKVSRLGTITSLTLDKLIYWTPGEDPVVRVNLSSTDGYQDPVATMTLTDGVTNILTKSTNTRAEKEQAMGENCTSQSQFDPGPAGQSFKALGTKITKMSGPLASAGTYELKVLEGEGTSGTVIYDENVTLPAAGSDPTALSTPITGLTIGSQYTMQFITDAFKCYDTGAPYSDGQAYNGASSANWHDMVVTLVFAEDAYEFMINDTFASSYENAYAVVTVNDSLYVETDQTQNATFDAMNIPVVTGPTTEQHGDYNVTWDAVSNNLGSVTYTVRKSVDGGNVTSLGTTTNTYWPVTANEEGDITYFVKAEDDYVNTTEGNRTVTVVLSPSFTSHLCSLTYPNEDDQPATAKLPVNFTVYAPLGFTSPSVTVKLMLNGENFTSTECSYNETDSTHRDYVCNMTIHYWYAPGDYALNITYVDGAKEVSEEWSSECAVGQLLASQRTVDVTTFSGAGPGVNDVKSSAAVTVRNTGNMPVTVLMKAYDLTGRTNPSIELPATAFKAGVNLTDAVQLQSGVAVNTTVVISPAENAKTDIWLWLSMPVNQLIQDYYAKTLWQVVGSG